MTSRYTFTLAFTMPSCPEISRHFRLGRELFRCAYEYMLTVVSNNPDDPSIDKISVWTTPEKKELVPLNQPTTIGMTRRLGKPEMVMTGLWIEGTKPGDIENEYTITLQVDWDVNGNRETKDYVPVDITVTPVMPPSAIISDLKPRPVKFAGDNVNVYWLVICK